MKLTPNNLKAQLWDTLNKVKSGKISAAKAQAVASQAREILRTIAIEIKLSNDVDFK